MFELEGRAIAEGLDKRFSEACKAAGIGELLDRIQRGYCERTPGGGLHLLHRIPTVPGNTKLARRPATHDELAIDPQDKVKVLIETRGQGGFVIVAPSHGRVHETGKPWTLIAGSFATIVTLSEDEHGALWSVARTFDRMPVEPPRDSRRAGSPEGDRPGDRYDARADIQSVTRELLERHGWTFVYEKGGAEYLRRPGKRIGISASLGHVAPGVLRVFTTSSDFDERAHSPFTVLVKLQFNGDPSAAAQWLLDQEGPHLDFGKRSKGGQGGTDEHEGGTSSQAEDDDDQPDDEDWVGAYGNDLVLPGDIRPEAFHGPIGEFAARVGGTHTMASPVSLLVTGLAAFGARCGRGTWRVWNEIPTYPLIFALFVGGTGDGKGISLRVTKRWLELLKDHDPSAVVSDFNSGEGLIQKLTRLDTDKIIGDARALAWSEEFAAVLRAKGRDGSTLGQILRRAYDGDRLERLTVKIDAAVEAPALSLVAHVTPEELLSEATTLDAASGFLESVPRRAAARHRCQGRGAAWC